MLEVHKFTDKHNICVGPVPEHFTLNDLLRIQESQFWYAVNPSIDAIRETRTEHLTAEPIAFTVHDKDVIIHDAIRPFQVGDVVKVGEVDKAWENYVDELDEYTGQTGLVGNIDENGEVRVGFQDKESWYYPASALTLVKPAQ
jgi:ribosomal protein L21E